MANCWGKSETIRHFRKLGCSELEIGLFLGVPARAVKRVMERRARRFLSSYADAVKAGRARGETYKTISIALGIGETTAWDLAHGKIRQHRQDQRTREAA